MSMKENDKSLTDFEFSISQDDIQVKPSQNKHNLSNQDFTHLILNYKNKLQNMNSREELSKSVIRSMKDTIKMQNELSVNVSGDNLRIRPNENRIIKIEKKKKSLGPKELL